jgi:putative YhbY family RNA-binding protein
MKQLTPAERRSLRARAHHLQPVVIVGEAGLTPAVLHELDVSLNAHELIKVKLQESDRLARATLSEALAASLDAATVQQIGKMLVVYRPRPEGETPASPKPRVRRREPRRTKRSYQMDQ